MIGAREEAIYWQQQSARTYRLARINYDKGYFRAATHYQKLAQGQFIAYLSEMATLNYATTLPQWQRDTARGTI